jgi:hypothetical protein
LLNVFLAIAVDNLADAESLTAIEKEAEEEVRMLLFVSIFVSVFNIDIFKNSGCHENGYL